MFNISRSKGNQTMNFDQLIEYNLRNIVLKKSHKRCSEEASPWPFPEKRKLSFISESTIWNVIQFVFIVWPSRGLPNILKRLYDVILVPLLLTLTRFHIFSGVSILDFEQVNTAWESFISIPHKMPEISWF